MECLRVLGTQYSNLLNIGLVESRETIPFTYFLRSQNKSESIYIQREREREREREVAHESCEENGEHNSRTYYAFMLLGIKYKVCDM